VDDRRTGAGGDQTPDLHDGPDGLVPVDEGLVALGFEVQALEHRGRRRLGRLDGRGDLAGGQGAVGGVERFEQIRNLGEDLEGGLAPALWARVDLDGRRRWLWWRLRLAIPTLRLGLDGLRLGLVAL